MIGESVAVTGELVEEFGEIWEIVEVFVENAGSLGILILYHRTFTLGLDVGSYVGRFLDDPGSFRMFSIEQFHLCIQRRCAGVALREDESENRGRRREEKVGTLLRDEDPHRAASNSRSTQPSLQN